MPDRLLNNKGRNTYFFLPLLLGLLGVFFTYLYRPKSFWVINSIEKKVEYKIDLPEKAENAIFSEAGRFVSFTKGDDLFVAFIDGKVLQITADGGNGIVNGQTVHRNEFGIAPHACSGADLGTGADIFT